MPKSELTQKLDVIQTAVQSFLKPLGFRRKGRTHNRSTEGGLTHVVNFQMGQYPIGEHYVVPGLRESFYGKMTVNLGVLLPVIYEVERQRPLPDFVQEYNCTIRARLNALALARDEWFKLGGDANALARDLVALLDRHALTFFDQFKTYPDVLSYYHAYGKLPHQNENRASLEAGLVAYQLGDKSLSKVLFERASASRHEGFGKHVAKLARRIGCPLD